MPLARQNPIDHRQSLFLPSESKGCPNLYGQVLQHLAMGYIHQFQSLKEWMGHLKLAIQLLLV